jgi:Na+/phosphate symporter
VHVQEIEANHDRIVADVTALENKRYDELNAEHSVLLEKLKIADKVIVKFEEEKKARLKAEEDKRMEEMKRKLEMERVANEKKKNKKSTNKVLIDKSVSAKAPVIVKATFRVAVIMVKCCVRLLKAFRTYNFRDLGALGLKMLLRRVSPHIRTHIHTRKRTYILHDTAIQRIVLEAS